MLVSHMELCEQIAMLDDSIAFAAITNKLGKVIACNRQNDQKTAALLLAGGDSAVFAAGGVSASGPPAKLPLPPLVEATLRAEGHLWIGHGTTQVIVIPLYDQYGNIGPLLQVAFDAAPNSRPALLVKDRILPLIRGNYDRRL